MKFTMKKILFYTIILITATLTSCSEDILDKEPLTEMPESVIWEDPNLAQAFVNARYNQVGHGWAESWMSSVCDESHLIWSRGCEPLTQGYVSPSDLGRMNGAWWGWITEAGLLFGEIFQIVICSWKM